MELICLFNDAVIAQLYEGLRSNDMVIMNSDLERIWKEAIVAYFWKDFSLPQHPDQLWGLPSLINIGYQLLCFRGKAAGT